VNESGKPKLKVEYKGERKTFLFSLRFSLVQVVNEGSKPKLQVEYKGERKTFLVISKILSGSGGE
jgi:hypothetical protein